MKAIIIPTYSQFNYVYNCLVSLQKTTDDYVVYLIDDASPDWNPDFLDRIKPLLPPGSVIERYKKNFGCTRSWNRGLQLAKENNAEFTVIANQDIILTHGWWDEMSKSLESLSLVAPMTNYTGYRPPQEIRNLIPNYKNNTHPDITAQSILGHPTIEARINGFFMLARTNDWWRNAFNKEEVFDPSYPLLGNECELQRRWKGKVGVCQSAFIYHYGSVSRKTKKNHVLML